MSHVNTRKGALTDEKDKRQPDNSPVRDMKKKVAANAEKEKMAAEKQNGGDKHTERKDNKHPEKSEKQVEKKDNKQNGDKQPEKGNKTTENKTADKPADKAADKKEKVAEKPADKKEKAADKPVEKKETEKAKEDSAKADKSAKPSDDKAKPKPATTDNAKPATKSTDNGKPAKSTDKPVQNGNGRQPHNGVSDVTLSTNGASDAALATTVSGDSDSEDMVIVIDDQENDELFPELTYDDTSDNEGFEGQDGFRSMTRRSQAKATRTPETPRPVDDKQSETTASATNMEEKDKSKEATKVLKLKEDPSSKLLSSPKKPQEGKGDEEIVVIEESENGQDGEARKPDTNFSKSRVKVSPYRRSMRLADQTTSSVNATYTGNNTTMEMDITESSYTELPSATEELSASGDLNGSHVSTLRNIRGRKSYKPLKELTLRTVTRRPPTMPVTEQPARPTGTVVGRKRKPEADEAIELAAEASDETHAKRMRLLDKLMSPFRRTVPSSTPLPLRRAAPIVGINTDLPLTAPVASTEPFEAEALKNVPTAAQPDAVPVTGDVTGSVVNGADDSAKRCVVM